MKYLHFKIYSFLIFESFLFSLMAQEWQLLGLETEEIEAIAVYPTNEDIIFAGSSSDFSAGKVGGIFKSTNGGASWDTLLWGVTVRDIDIHPFNPEIVYVTAGINSLTLPGVLKTEDGGMNWFHADSGILMYWEEGPGVLAIDPLHPDTLYAGTGGFFGGNLYKSTDGGNQWEAIGDTIMNWNGVTAIAIDPNNTNTLYAGTAWIGAICKSTDGGGVNWERLDFPEVGLVHDLIVHTTSSDTVYAGTWFYGFYQSTNSGISWYSENSGLSDTVSIRKIIKDSTTIYIAGNDMSIGAVYQSNQNNIIWVMIGNDGFEQGVNTINFLTNKNKILAGTSGIYSYNITTDIVSEKGKFPRAYLLMQNYPNPFNYQTIITQVSHTLNCSTNLILS